MEDDGEMAKMYLTEKKETMEPYSSTDQYFQSITSGSGVMSKFVPILPVDSFTGANKLARNFSNLMMSSRHGSSTLSSVKGYNIEKLEMLHEAYFMSIDNTLSKILSLKECIDNTEDFIDIKLENFQNWLIQFKLLLAAATFGATMFRCHDWSLWNEPCIWKLCDSQEEVQMREDVTPSLSNTTSSDSQKGVVDLEDNLKLLFVSN
ncbi:hypothetical protein GIB67_036851 [Kingdonia uniflora]|uniref:Uncharacterized protein n=1 Tax=Kingdonia uniflora TaxID=39325 RepID=A0A7J7LX34_9MAGN|nr:hypothetical protein GIB67_036851 [Kingdonia uniflora]